MKFPLVRELAARGFPVRLTCGVLGFSAQAFSRWCSDPVSPRDYDDAHLVDAIRDVHSDDPEFGYRFISDELECASHPVGERRVWWLCSEHKIWTTTTKRQKGRREAPRTGGARRPQSPRRPIAIDRSLWGSIGAASRWCSRSCHAARDCGDRRSRRGARCRSSRRPGCARCHRCPESGRGYRRWRRRAAGGGSRGHWACGT
jgi:hypothetical protein